MIIRAVGLSLAILLVPSVVQAGTVSFPCRSEQPVPTHATADFAR